LVQLLESSYARKRASEGVTCTGEQQSTQDMERRERREKAE
jgi:hypothetical protein